MEAVFNFSFLKEESGPVICISLTFDFELIDLVLGNVE
jgi:hypothetical protein